MVITKRKISPSKHARETDNRDDCESVPPAPLPDRTDTTKSDRAGPRDGGSGDASSDDRGASPSAAAVDALEKNRRTGLGILREGSRGPLPPAGKAHPRAPAVSFGAVSVRDYEVVLGDHPCCAHGPAIAIGSKYHERGPQHLDEFETVTTRMNADGIYLDYRQRMHLLGGYTIPEIEAAMEEGRRVRRNRATTNRLQVFHILAFAVRRRLRTLKAKVAE